MAGWDCLYGWAICAADMGVVGEMMHADTDGADSSGTRKPCGASQLSLLTSVASENL